MKVVITSGGTREKIDPVRYIGNYSSGKMGAALAAAFTSKGYKVTVISAPATADYKGKVIRVESAEEMLKAAKKLLPCDIFISAAAVADKRPKKYSKTKIKKENFKKIELTENPDILKTIGASKARPKLLIGFAAESSNHIANARKKLTKKSCDLIILYDIKALGDDKNEVWLIGKKFEQKIAKASKAEIAKKIVKFIEENYGTN